MKMTLQEFNKKWKYKTDLEKYGVKELWEEPKPGSNGYYESDCESYAIFLKRNIDGFRDWDYYWCRLNGEGHCILYKNGDVIDCNTKSIFSYSEYCRRYKVTEFKKYNWFVVFSKILFSKAYVWIHSLKN